MAIRDEDLSNKDYCNLYYGVRVLDTSYFFLVPVNFKFNSSNIQFPYFLEWFHDDQVTDDSLHICAVFLQSFNRYDGLSVRPSTIYSSQVVHLVNLCLLPSNSIHVPTPSMMN